MTLLLLQVAGCTIVRAQGGWSQEAACPGWHNPTSFVTGNPNYYYNGQVGQRANAVPDVMSGQTGLTNVSTYFAAGTLHTVTTSALTHEGNLPLPNQRFAIMTDATGADANTGGNLAYVPEGFSSSIRVGNAAVSEAVNASILSYTMRVTPDNALLLLHYALVVQQPSHNDATRDPLFNVRVMRDNAGTWQTVSDTLAWFHKVSQSGIVPGSDGWQVAGGGTVYYKNWTTAAIDLTAMLNQDVRIEVAVAGCQYGTHWAYAYVAGDCRPMTTTLMCSGGSATAPAGLAGYRWMASMWGQLAAPYSPDAFRALTDTLTGSGANHYAAQPTDFRVTRRLTDTGDTTDCDSMATCQTFCCEMATALDPTKPYTVRQYFTLCNTRLEPAMEVRLSCDGTGKVVDKSLVTSPTDTLECDHAEWDFYGDSTMSGSPRITIISTSAGDSVAVPFALGDTLWVRMRTRHSASGCEGEATRMLVVRRTPTLTVSGYRHLSAGTTSDITASSDVECALQWSATLGSITGGLPGGPHLRVAVNSGRATYYVQATTEGGCTAWDSVTLFTGMRDTNFAGLFSQINIDTLVCMEQRQTVRIGHAVTNEVVVVDHQATLSHPGRVFLPDGVPCNGTCTYRSPVTFDNFLPGQTVSSVEEIVYVRLNIEHSYIGGLYVSLRCPNGTRATLMRFNGDSSPCRDTIPTSARNWHSGSNVSGQTNLGVPNSGNSTTEHKCDSTHADNAPGTGWNYCWSDNTTAGITYAAGDGRIYRQGNISNSEGSIDSSNVAAKSQFYHPDESLSSLIGCPLNGTWVIEVIDGYSGDNGYVFDWELSLDARMFTDNIIITGSNVVGDRVEQVNDSTYVLGAPAGAVGDTTVSYIIQLMDSLGMVADTTVSIHYVATERKLERHRACAGDTVWIGTEAFTETTHRFDTAYTDLGCMVITEIDVVVNPTYEFYDTANYCPREAIEWRGWTFDHYGDTTLRLLTGADCDSVHHLSLILRDSAFRAQMEVSTNGEQWSSDTMMAGCRPFGLYLRDLSDGQSRTWYTGDGSMLTDSTYGYTYDSAGVYDIVLVATSPYGCRDTAVMKQAVWVFELPKPEFAWNPENPVMSHPTAEMINLSEPSDAYLWRFSRADGFGTDSIKDFAPTYTWGNSEENIYGNYAVTLVAELTYILPWSDTLHCRDSVTHEVEIINDWLQFPNLVTPNGDGTNDTWRVVNLLEVGMYPMNELWIYDHWGALVYHVKNIRRESDFWDPNDRNCPDGTYYFRFSAKSPYGHVRTNGTIEVMRDER